jgi:hypothetical protein
MRTLQYAGQNSMTVTTLPGHQHSATHENSWNNVTQLPDAKLFTEPLPEIFGAVTQRRSCHAIHAASISRQFTHTEDSTVHPSARCHDFHHDSQSHFTEWCGRLQWVLPILLPNEKTFSSCITNKQENISLQYRLLH